MKFSNLFRNTIDRAVQTIAPTPTPAPTYTVEQIHAEIDTAQDRLLLQADEFIAGLNIPTETQVERKATLLEELGFKASETVAQANSLRSERSRQETALVTTKQLADSLHYFKTTYPFQKFLTVDELDRICNKYGLLHAPVKNYIKDVPEKNLLQIKETTKLNHLDSCSIEYAIIDFTFWNGATSEYKEWVKENILSKTFSSLPLDNSGTITERTLEILCHQFKGERGTKYYFGEAKVKKIDRTGLFIAAPPSHFDLKDLQKETKHGYFNVTVTEIKDPIVFEYCRDNIVRVLTKWGTDDDQSYLDESLVNEKMN